MPGTITAMSEPTSTEKTSNQPEIPMREVRFPIAGGELVLELPADISEQRLNKEIAGQNIIRRKLLDSIDRLDRVIGSNRELFLCSKRKLHTTSREFLAICTELLRFFEDFASYHSAIPELEEAREDVETFFHARIRGEAKGVETAHSEIFTDAEEFAVDLDRSKVDLFRKRLAKSAGIVRTELQKIFAYLMARDPRNLYRNHGAKSEKDILFRQFRHDVEVTEHLYTAVRRLDTYMRGAIVPSDLLQVTSDRILREESIACLFQSDYMHFIDALIEEILEQLSPEIQRVLHMDGIWYDDFDNFQSKTQRMADLCTSFRVFYAERSGLREALTGAFEESNIGETEDRQLLLRVFDKFRFAEVSHQIRSLDQMLVDLEVSFLQWEKGIAKRAFAREEWRAAEPVHQRRTEKSVVFKT